MSEVNSPNPPMTSSQPVLLTPEPETVLIEGNGDNPCGCCCSLLLTTKIFALSNLIFVILDSIGSITTLTFQIQAYSSNSSSIKIPWIELFENNSNFKHECFIGCDVVSLAIKSSKLLIIICLELCIASLFVNGVFYNPTPRNRFRYTTWYMYFNRFPPMMLLILIEIIVYFSVEGSKCLSWENILIWLLILLVNCVWYYYNQAVANGYLKCLSRTLFLVEDDQAIGSELNPSGGEGDNIRKKVAMDAETLNPKPEWKDLE